MKKKIEFNWEIFKNDGFKFQDMCADIFEYHNYYVSKVMRKGGSDEGRDIIVYKNAPTDLIEFNKNPYAWVECKSRINGAGITLKDISVNFVYILRENNVSNMIFMTNYEFNNEAFNLLESYNNCSHLPFKVRHIEQKELEKILKSAMPVYIKYFDPDGKTDDYETIVDNFSLEYNASTNSQFVDEYESLKIELRNTDFNKNILNINFPDGYVINVTLEPLEEKTILIKPEINAIPQEICITYKNEVQEIKLESKKQINNNLSYKIDHIYVDPFKLKEEIISQIKKYFCVYISGGAGTGKSRLLKEVSKTLEKKPVLIDLSNNYNKSFIDFLLSALLEIEIDYLKILPEEIIDYHLKQNNIEDPNAIKILTSYIKEDTKNLNYDVIISESARLFIRKFQKRLIFIDNIHKFTILDFKLFEEIIKCNDSNQIICTARENEITEQNLKAYLLKLGENQTIGIINLQTINIIKAIDNFIEEVSYDNSTKNFLKIYQTAENFQQFIFSLKTLRSKNILQHKDQGKLIISNKLESLKLLNYVEIYNDLINYFKLKFPNRPIDELLKIGAVYGFSFPAELIEQIIGKEANNLIDDMIINELLVFNGSEIGNATFIRFDHELTREIIYNAIPPIQKRKLHNQIIDYIESLGETSSLYSFSQLAYHYENVNNFSKTALLLNKDGHKLKRKSQPEFALKQFNLSLDFVKKVQKDNVGDLFELEADNLNERIMLIGDLDGTIKSYDSIRSLHVLTNFIPDTHYLGLVYYYFSRYYFDNDDDELNKATFYIDEAIKYFKQSNLNDNYGKAINLKGVIEKNNGEFPLAIKLHNEAILIFEKNSNWEGLSEALTDLGAVYLESGDGLKTLEIWKRSLNVIKKTLNFTEICNRLVEYSYILALYNEENSDIYGELQNALEMSKRLNLKPNICRAKINFANYLFDKDINKIDMVKSLITDAINESKEMSNEYLNLLSKFSYKVFSTKFKKEFKDKYDDDISNQLMNYMTGTINSERGDNRIINIIKFFIYENNHKILYELKNVQNPRLKTFIKKIKTEKLDVIEKDNPYFQDGFFLTYY